MRGWWPLVAARLLGCLAASLLGRLAALWMCCGCAGFAPWLCLAARLLARLALVASLVDFLAVVLGWPAGVGFEPPHLRG